VNPLAVWAIGLGQLINWGILYFAFGVLLIPLEEGLGAPRWLVAGAFSFGLLISAAAAPTVGRLTDRGQGPAMMRAGGLAGAALLIAWALVPTLWMTYVAWGALGLSMAAILYEPVFAIVGRAFADSERRLRAIATVTVLGGLASTAFLPGTQALVNRFGWRGAVVVLAVVLAVSALVVTHVAFRDLEWSARSIREALNGAQSGSAVALRGLNRLAVIFAMSIVVNAAVSSNLVAALIDRGLTPTLAASVAGTFGLMQVPGRLLMTNRSFTPHPLNLLLFSFAIQVIGLAALMVHGTAAMWAGVILFASGAGLTTLARPFLVLHEYGAENAGYANGVIARSQQLARAAGPVAAAAMATFTGYGPVFAACAGLIVAAMMAARAPRQ
jgi:MFS family permease